MYFGGLKSDLSKFKHVDKDIKVASTNTVPLPSSVDYRNCLKPCRNQGQRPTCVAFATSAAVEYQWYKNTQDNSYISPEFIYESRDNTDDGMSIYNALTIIKTNGNVTESKFPYLSKDARSIPSSITTLAEQYKIDSFYQISNLNELKQSLVTDGVCIVLFPVYSAASTTFWLKNETTDTEITYHGISIVGYDDKQQQFIVRNSWGTDWGQDGYTFWPYTQFSSALELWGIKSTNKAQLPPDPVENVSKSNCKCIVM
jgi:C1A family cysteine protease